MFGAIAGGIASALAGGAMSKLFGGGQKAASGRSEERFSRNAETDLVCRLLLEKKKQSQQEYSSDQSMRRWWVAFKVTSTRSMQGRVWLPAPQQKRPRVTMQLLHAVSILRVLCL